MAVSSIGSLPLGRAHKIATDCANREAQQCTKRRYPGNLGTLNPMEKKRRPKISRLTSVGRVGTEIGRIYGLMRNGDIDTADVARMCNGLLGIKSCLEVSPIEQQLAELRELIRGPAPLAEVTPSAREPDVRPRRPVAIKGPDCRDHSLGHDQLGDGRPNSSVRGLRVRPLEFSRNADLQREQLSAFLPGGRDSPRVIHTTTKKAPAETDAPNEMKMRPFGEITSSPT
jgi:hypothetical protein